MKNLLIIVFFLFLLSCGFQLRGVALIPFKTIYISGQEGNKVNSDLKRAIQARSDTNVIDKIEGAEAVLELIHANYSKHILSVSGSGRVREFELRYHINYRLTNAKGQDVIPVSSIALTRIMPFGDAQVLAKQDEERMLVNEMRRDAVNQLMRRLSKVK